MTKKQMTETLQKMEAAVFLTMQTSREQFGKDSSILKIDRAQWAAIHEALEATGIKPAGELPDNKAAFSIVSRLTTA